jgi:ribosomal protein S18 acetylase RimI-like enzyme
MAVSLADKFVVRNASRDELDVAIRLGVTVLREWHVSPSEFSCAYALDPTGFFVGELNGEIISLINCIKYHGHSAFISTFLVKAEYRGKGYGRQTWDTAWKSLDKSITLHVGLDAVTDMVPKYEILGFHSVWNTLVVVLDLEMITEIFLEFPILLSPLNQSAPLM